MNINVKPRAKQNEKAHAWLRNRTGLNPMTLPFWFDNRRLIDIQRTDPRTSTSGLYSRCMWPRGAGCGSVRLLATSHPADVSEVIQFLESGFVISFGPFWSLFDGSWSLILLWMVPNPTASNRSSCINFWPNDLRSYSHIHPQWHA